jgi:hypothetical protein
MTRSFEKIPGIANAHELSTNTRLRRRVAKRHFAYKNNSLFDRVHARESDERNKQTADLLCGA